MYTITYHTEFCTKTKSKLEKRTLLIKLSINLQLFLSIKCAILLRLTHNFTYSKLLLSHTPNIMYIALFIQLSNTRIFAEDDNINSIPIFRKNEFQVLTCKNACNILLLSQYVLHDYDYVMPM